MSRTKDPGRPRTHRRTNTSRHALQTRIESTERRKLQRIYNSLGLLSMADAMRYLIRREHKKIADSESVAQGHVPGTSKEAGNFPLRINMLEWQQLKEIGEKRGLSVKNDVIRFLIRKYPTPK